MARLGRSFPNHAYRIRPVAAAAAAPSSITNSFSGTSGATVTPANSAGTGNTAFDVVNVGSGCTVAYDTTVGGAAGGTTALKLAIGATAAAADVEWTTAFGTQSTVYGRFYIQVTANPAASVRVFTAATPGGAALCAAIYLMTDGTLLLANSAVGTAAQTVGTVNLGSWTRVEFKLTLSATTGQGTVSLFKSPDSATATETVSSTATQNLTGAASLFSFGTGFDTKASIGPYWLDEVGLSSLAYLGPVGSGSSAANAAGAITLGGSATPTAAGIGSGSVALGGSASASGAVTAAGSITLGATATGGTLGAATGSVTLGGSATGGAGAIAAGAVTLSGAGTSAGAATASGTITLGGTATAALPGAIAAGSVALGGTATAAARATGTGSVALAGAASALVAASSSGSVSLAGSGTPRASVTASGAVILGGAATARVPASAAGLLTLTGLAVASAAQYVTHTYVTATLADLGGTATLATDGTSGAAVAIAPLGLAALAGIPGFAALASNGQSAAVLTGDGTSSAALADVAGSVTLQTTT